MARSRKKEERRRFQRFQVHKDAYAMITPFSHKKSEIIDISKGGLALRYTADSRRHAESAEIDPFLHIFVQDISFCLLRMPVRTVSDFELPADDPGTRRRSVAFGPLSKRQASDLEYFLEHHVVNE
ncbi:MAG: hypothetical protein JRI36_06490 [Deltaproteobacteria bacterium]|nr:hypothetical protein [Deltaproteobacteria bacterium]